VFISCSFFRITHPVARVYTTMFNLYRQTQERHPRAGLCIMTNGYSNNTNHQQMHKESFIINRNILLHVSTLLGHLQAELFVIVTLRLHFTVEWECAVDCVLRCFWRRELSAVRACTAGRDVSILITQSVFFMSKHTIKMRNKLIIFIINILLNF
jgi:hypothetical protein